jgi:hypothetical protein
VQWVEAWEREREAGILGSKYNVVDARKRERAAAVAWAEVVTARVEECRALQTKGREISVEHSTEFPPEIRRWDMLGYGAEEEAERWEEAMEARVVADDHHKMLIDKHHASMFMLAARTGREEDVHRLLRKEVDVDIAMACGTTALMLAAQNNKLRMVKVLLKEGAKLDATDMDGVTALMKGCRNDHGGVVRLLLLGGAALDVADNDGETALMKATWYTGWMREDTTLRLLLAAGAALHLKDKYGQTAYIKTESCGNYMARKELQTAEEKARRENATESMSDTDSDPGDTDVDSEDVCSYNSFFFLLLLVYLRSVYVEV